jgi:hypothetical protein
VHPFRATLLVLACLLTACPRPKPVDDGGGSSPADAAVVVPIDGGSDPADASVVIADASVVLDASVATDAAMPPTDAAVPDAFVPPAGDAGVVLNPCADCFVVRAGFPVDLPMGPTRLGPIALGNVDGVPGQEILVTVEDATHTMGALARVTLAGAVDVFPLGRGAAASGPVLVDVNGDNTPDVLWGDHASSVLAHVYAGAAATGFPRSAGLMVQAQGVSARFNPVTLQTVVSFSVNANLFRVLSTGGNAPGWPSELSESVLQDGVATCELNGDTSEELVAVVVTGGVTKIAAFNAVGTLLPGFPSAVTLDLSPWPPTCVDVDGDGLDEIAYVDTTGRLHLLTPQGTQRPGFPVMVGPNVTTAVSAGDLNADGHPDLVVASGAAGGAGSLIAVDAFVASVMPGFPVGVGSAVNGAPLLADTDGDGRDDVVAVTFLGKVVVVDSRGSLRPVMAADLGGNPVGAPSLADLDGDGKWDLVVASQTKLWVGTLKGSANLGHAPWVRYRGHDGKTSRYLGEAYAP